MFGILQSVFYTLVTFSGFLLFQRYGYTQFCALDRPWCTEKIPLLYSFVQKEYWFVFLLKEREINTLTFFIIRDNGFLAYYEVKQIPNFVLAAPIIILSVLGLKKYIQFDPARFWSIGTLSKKKSISTVEEQSFVSSRLSVYMYLWAFLLLYVVTTMHIQVIIRFFTSLPPLYWYVGELWIKGFDEKKNTLGANIVLGYFVLYGLIGIVLFASFLPPA